MEQNASCDINWAAPQGGTLSHSLQSPEGFLESSPTSVASMDAGLQAYCIGACTGKATYCAHKWVFARFYEARLFWTATFNVCLVALYHVVFFGFIKIHPNTAPGDINESEVRRS